ncbi:MAG: Hint domain-containing protein [Myxococcales bacterium]|nr:Hint domain-containing protein [Myxococcales bacterium]
MKLIQKLGLSVVLGASAACCVAKGTRVRTKRGERLVETLQVGDEVTCIEPVTGQRVSTTLSAMRTAQRECVTLSTTRGVLKCTTDHPLYDPDTATWADAGDWVLGKRSTLLWVPEADDAPLERVVVEAGNTVSLEQVFDLTVDHALHDFVANGLLVHNKSPPITRCDPDAGPTYTCSCAPGFTPISSCPDGRLDCDCVPSDAGVRDAGTTDGGVDGGP